jgi:diphosphomevalonate decarboxylase
MQASARAQPNIALIKYWGKRDRRRNLPAVDSLSLTLADLYTEMRVRLDPALAADHLTVNGIADPVLLPRVSRCLDSVAGAHRPAAAVESACNFPLGAGLASSASAFAALVLAAASAVGSELDTAALASLAGQASGSAARSLYGGFVVLRNEADRVRVESVLAGAAWPLRLVVAVTDPRPKPTGSGEAMEISRQTSAFYGRWIDEQPADLESALTAIERRDFAALGQVAEHNCLKMHSVMWTSRPPIVFWNPATVACLETVRRLQSDGVQVFFTMDAGPQVKAICTPDAAADVSAALGATAGVRELLSSGLGEGARLLEVTS